MFRLVESVHLHGQSHTNWQPGEQFNCLNSVTSLAHTVQGKQITITNNEKSYENCTNKFTCNEKWCWKLMAMFQGSQNTIVKHL